MNINRMPAPTKRPLRQRIIAIPLTIVMGLGLLSGCGKNVSPMPAILNKYAISTAEYPSVAPYPTADPNSQWSSKKFQKQYDAWRQDRDDRQQYFGTAENLDPFFVDTLREFLCQNETDNQMYSPLNVYMALAMLAETTDGNSRAQILNLLGADTIDALRLQASNIWNANYRNDGIVTNVLANSIWLNDSIDFKQPSIDALRDHYFASAYQGTMGSNDFDKALQAWINWQTGDLLKEQVNGIKMSPETVMAIVSSIYFKAKWQDEFSENENSQKIFHGALQDRECTFMNQTWSYGNYFWGEHFSAVYVPLQESTGMWLYLPEEEYSPQDLLQDEEFLSFMFPNDAEWEKQKLAVINLSLPKFDISSRMSLIEGLQRLGVTDCFDADIADFSSLTDQDTVVSEIEHGVRVAIDEQGISAAAYTEMLLCGASEPPDEEIDFVLDRPFVFAIKNDDGLPLFVGTVNQL